MEACSVVDSECNAKAALRSQEATWTAWPAEPYGSESICRGKEASYELMASLKMVIAM